MFEFDAGKLIIIGIVALIVIGPKDLPRVLRQAGQAMAKLRRMAAEFRGQFDEAMREAELSEIQEEAAKLAALGKIGAGINPLAEIKSELTRAIEGKAPETAVAAAGPPTAVAGQGGPADAASAVGPEETGTPGASAGGGAHGDPGLPLDQALPVSRT
jgi:sec-independent protein translocase protein TatB